MKIEIRLATSADDLAAVQRQRHAIHVQELGYPPSRADPLDGSGRIFCAFDGAELVASVRVNYDHFGDYEALYPMRRFGTHFPAGMSVVTKLMIAPAWRAGTLMARLGLTLYVHTRDHRPQTQFCLIDCVPPLKRFFLRLGYRQIGPAIAHPAAGPVLPMAFAVYDREHFDRVGSPLAAVCPHHDSTTAAWFADTFATELEAYACATA